MSEKLMGSEIPSDVVEDILVQLPVKSLIRFKSLDKSSSSLIRNPTFAHKQLQLHHRRQQSTSGFDHALVVMSSDNKPLAHVFLVDSPGQLQIPLDARQCSRSLLCESDMNFVGHCNGLICCFRACKVITNMDFSLWNPILRQRKDVPESGITLYRIYGSKNCLGFGHEPKSRDYKIVRLAFHFNKMQAEVYSLRADSWRRVGHTTLALFKFLHRSIICRGVCLGGFCYWLLVQSNISHDEHVILLFDLSNEVFHVMQLPEIMSQHMLARRTELMEWNKSVAVVAYSSPGRPSSGGGLDVWLLDDVENQKLDSVCGTISVKRYFVIPIDDPLNRFREVMLFWNDEVVLNHVRMDRRARYHLTTLKTLKDDYSEEGNCSKYFKIVGYTKSLVSII